MPILMTAVLCTIAQAGSSSIFTVASPQAEKIESLGNGFLVAGAAMMMLVIALTVYITIKYRASKQSGEPKQTRGNRKVELLMVGVPLALVIFFFFWSLRTMSAIMPPRTNQKPDVIITGHQWWWQADYPAGHFSTANEIHLPVGRPLLLQLDAADVIHDWWVPSLGPKIDMIPGRSNYLWVTINKPGIYGGTCSEFCGRQHAWMRIRVVAQKPAAFRQWEANQKTSAAKPTDSLAQAGETLFATASCSSCHRIRGIGANGNIGPDLTHLGSRQTILSGMMPNSPANLYRWLQNPQKVKPGAHMPRFIFNRDSIRSLTAYLSQLK